MNKSDSIGELAKALATAQGEIENASKNAKNPHFKSNYADLAEVINTVRPIMSKHGISISQFPAFDSGLASVETIVMHHSGEWMSGISSAPVGKQDAQGVGSAITYLRRYSLAAIAGIAQEDDDGNSAVGGQRQQRQAPPHQQKTVDVDKAVAAIRGAGDAATINKYVQSAQSRGASGLQMQSIQAAATERLGELEGAPA